MCSNKLKLAKIKNKNNIEKIIIIPFNELVIG